MHLLEEEVLIESRIKGAVVCPCLSLNVYISYNTERVRLFSVQVHRWEVSCVFDCEQDKSIVRIGSSSGNGTRNRERGSCSFVVL